MEHWQEQYIENTRRIALLDNFFNSQASGFDEWMEERRRAGAEIKNLRRKNVSLLGRYLFPMLDGLHSAGEEEKASLTAFAEELLDWRTNLDCGVYVAVHDALLSVCRLRRDRNGVIRELYKLGMGYYYLRRFMTGIDDPCVRPYAFRNEMLFTEAGSYIRYYDEICDEETRGYMIRAMANVALCAEDRSRKIAASAKTLQITQDEAYREKAPGLPWDAFVRKTHQQMCANRSDLSRGNLTKEELALVLESCYEVFRPEDETEHPSVRWLWPYYEMEYNCGYVGLDTTMRRLESLITRTPEGQYDMSGLYGNVQLPIYYGRLIKENVRADTPARIRFLDRAYRKMLRTLLTCPQEAMDDYFFYTIGAVITDYYEVPGVPSYRETMKTLIRRFGGERYLRFRKTGAVLRHLCCAMLEAEPGIFDDLPLADGLSSEEKKNAVGKFAEETGLFLDFGQIKMNIGRTMHTRNLFENEYRMYEMHTVSGYNDLAARASTAAFADTALGHHRWYDGTGGYPERYERNASPYRMITDAAACAVVLTADRNRDFEASVRMIREGEGKRFSPMAAAFFSDETFLTGIRAVLEEDESRYYREIWTEMKKYAAYGKTE